MSQDEEMVTSSPEKKQKKQKKEKKSKKSKKEDKPKKEKKEESAEVDPAPAPDADSTNPFLFKGKKEKKMKVVDEKDGEEDGDEKADQVNEDEPTSEQKKDADTPASKRKRKRKRKTTDNTEGEEKDEDGKDVDPTSADAVPESLVANTVYVEGIPFDTTRDELRKFFVNNGNGAIKDESILEMRLPTWQDSGRLKGYGHVAFTDSKAYMAAIQDVNGKYMGKRFLKVTKSNRSRAASKNRPSRPSGPPPPDCVTVYCHNLPYTAVEAEIEDAFASFGTVKDVRISRHSGTKRSKGFGYVTMSSTSEATAAVTSSKPVVVGGRQLRLDYDTGVVKGSFRTSTGELWSKTQRQKAQAQKE